jgi:DNA repair exonuclease SbcCD ATPase subunit
MKTLIPKIKKVESSAPTIAFVNEDSYHLSFYDYSCNVCFFTQKLQEYRIYLDLQNIYEDLRKAAGDDPMMFTFDELLNWARPLEMVVDHRNKTPEMMEVLQNEWKAFGQSKIAPLHRAYEINRLKRKLEVLTESSDDTGEQEKDLGMEITRLESETLEERNQRKEEDDRKKEEARKRKEEEDDRKKEEARKRKEEARKRKEEARKRKEEEDDRKKEHVKHARQQKKEQEEQVPKARGKYKKFDDQMEDLKRFKETHGHVNVSNPEDKSLAAFCKRAGHAHKNPGNGKQLTAERIAAFDALVFIWTSKTYVTKSFNERIEDLEEYKRTHGHLNVKIHEDNSLSRFCMDVRHSLKHVEKDGIRKLTVERIARLDDLGFKW